ncbi:MAG: aldo/keto reductase [Pseudomonadota bacterium]
MSTPLQSSSSLTAPTAKMAKSNSLAVRKLGNTELSLTELGFGGASVGNLHRASTDAEAYGAMAAALDAGVLYFDTAPHYGHGLSEQRFGTFFAGRKPDHLVLSTKVGRLLEPSGPEGAPDHGFVDPLPFTQVYDYSYDGVMRSFEQSQKRLKGLPIDILLMHDIGAHTHGQENHARLFAQAINDGFRAMQELKDAGDVSAIGLGVNEWEVCLEALEHTDPDVFMLAGRHTLLEREASKNLFPTCTERNVSVISAAPFNSGLLARRPDASSRYNYQHAPSEIVVVAQELFDNVEQRGGSLQAAALQFPLRHPCVVSIVGGMANAERVQSTIGWLKENVSAEVWTYLESDQSLSSRK